MRIFRRVRAQIRKVHVKRVDAWSSRSCATRYKSFVVVGCGDVEVIGRHDGRIQRLDISYMHLH
jgi:hypothetical protein